MHRNLHRPHVCLVGLPPALPQVNQFVKLTGWTDSCPEPGNQESCRVYIAEGGDSLSTIAMAFSVDLSAVRCVCDAACWFPGGCCCCAV